MQRLQTAHSSLFGILVRETIDIVSRSAVTRGLERRVKHAKQGHFYEGGTILDHIIMVDT